MTEQREEQTKLTDEEIKATIQNYKVIPQLQTGLRNLDPKARAEARALIQSDLQVPLQENPDVFDIHNYLGLHRQAIKSRLPKDYQEFLDLEGVADDYQTAQTRQEEQEAINRMTELYSPILEERLNQAYSGFEDVQALIESGKKLAFDRGNGENLAMAVRTHAYTTYSKRCPVVAQMLKEARERAEQASE